MGKRQQPTLRNPQRICLFCNNEYTAKAPMQKTCSMPCRIKLWQSNIKRHKSRHPDAMKQYNVARKNRTPNIWRDKARASRLEILKVLGGKCIVCAVKNPNWLHIDYAPTMQGTGMRHPRHKKWIMDNIKDFRILCANHHYELTITGKIEGTNITQSKTTNGKN